MLTKVLSLILIIAAPLAQAQSMLSGRSSASVDISALGGGNQPVWELLAKKVYEDEGIDSVPESEKEELRRYLFADYLGYLNAIGIELAAFENTLKGREEIKDRGECSDETIEAYNDLLTNSVQSDLYTFTDTYCNSACRQKAEFDFGLIAHFSQPDGLPQTCADKAKEMYDAYHCNEFGDNDPAATASDGTGTSDIIPSNSGTHHTTMPDFGGSDSKLLPKDLSAVRGTISRIDPDLPVRGVGQGGGIKLIPLPKLPDLKSRVDIDRDFKSVLSKKKKVCAKKRSDLSRQIFSAPDGSVKPSSSTAPVRDPMDPRWTTTSEGKPESENKIETTEPRNPACKFSGMEMIDHFASLRKAYNRISREKIIESLGHWPIYDEEGVLLKDLVKSITWTADRFFWALINDIEAQHKRACGAGGTSLVSDMGETTTIGGRDYTVTIRPEEPGQPEEPKEDDDDKAEQEEPVTVSTYFNANQSAAEALINGFFGAQLIGAGTHTEARAGEIAAGVRDGTIAPGDIGSEAAKGPLGRNAEEIEKLTRRYLAQGNYQGLKIFAAEILGGVISGGIAGGVVKGVGTVGAKISMAASSGRISTLFMAARGVIMRPFLLGAESGSINWAIKVLQTGGRTLEERTAKALNKYFEKNLSKREWGTALEKLKKKNGLRNDHHGKILSNGDYVDTSGMWLGNIEDYLF